MKMTINVKKYIFEEQIENNYIYMAKCDNNTYEKKCAIVDDNDNGKLLYFFFLLKIKILDQKRESNLNTRVR